jgi:hypothetical protein
VKNLCPQVDVSRRVLTYSEVHLPSFLVRILALAERIHRWKRDAVGRRASLGPSSVKVSR